MKIEYDNEEIKSLVNHKYIGGYKKYKSNTKLIRNIDKVIKLLENANDIESISKINSLHYEHLTNNIYSSVRVGYDTKYRLILFEKEDKLTLLLFEINEHYGDH